MRGRPSARRPSDHHHRLTCTSRRMTLPTNIALDPSPRQAPFPRALHRSAASPQPLFSKLPRNPIHSTGPALAGRSGFAERRLLKRLHLFQRRPMCADLIPVRRSSFEQFQTPLFIGDACEHRYLTFMRCWQPFDADRFVPSPKRVAHGAATVREGSQVAKCRWPSVSSSLLSSRG